MPLIPHAGEIALIVGVILLIFGLGRLPQISYALAGAKKYEGKGNVGDGTSAEPERAAAAPEDASNDAADA